MNPIHTIDYIRILPELVLTAFGIIVMMADPLLKPGASRKGLGLVALGWHNRRDCSHFLPDCLERPRCQLRRARLVRHGARG